MERSGSQKVLRVASIIEIVLAILVIIVGIMGFLAIGATSASLATSDAQANGVVQSTADTLALGFGVIMVVLGVWCLLCGIFGLRAANDNQKIMVVWVFLLIGLVLQIITVIFAILNAFADTSFWSIVGSTVWSVFMFWIANNIKQEAGK